MGFELQHAWTMGKVLFNLNEAKLYGKILGKVYLNIISTIHIISIYSTTDLSRFLRVV